MARRRSRVARRTGPGAHRWLAASALAAVACAAPPQRYEIPFEYASMAAGNEGVRDVVVLPQDGEPRAVSDALFHAVQSLEMSIVEPEVGAGELLPTGTVLETDFVTLSRETIHEHNRTPGVARLHDDLLYRLAYRLEYSLGDKRIDLRLWAVLERRGSGGAWHEDGSAYSRRFFTERLRGEIERALKGADGP